MRLSTRHPGVFVFLAMCCAVAACAPPRAVAPPSEYLVATVEPGDTFSAIALRYLKDPSLGGLISDFNRTETLEPGQQILIPLYPFGRGGIGKEGYQVVPVLRYRWAEPEGAETPPETVESFRRQMAYLRENGFTVVALHQLYAFLQFKALLPGKTVAITFDDPVPGVFEAAFPILRTFGYPAAVFVQTGSVGGPGGLTWDQLKELSVNGWNVESRGRSRRRLGEPLQGESFDSYLAALTEELAASRSEIEQRLGTPCRYLAYPSGKAGRLTAAFAEKAGYQGAFVAEGPPFPFFADRFRLGRTPLSPDLDAEQFGNMLKTFEKAGPP